MASSSPSISASSLACARAPQLSPAAACALPAAACALPAPQPAAEAARRKPTPAGAQGARTRVRAWMRPMRWLSFSRSRNAPAVSVASAFTCASAPPRLTARRPPRTPAAQTRGGVDERAQRRAHARAAAEAGARMRGRRGAPGAAGLRSRAPPRCCRRRRAAARPRTSAPAPAPARAARGSAGRLRAARGRAAAERSRPPDAAPMPEGGQEERHGGPSARGRPACSARALAAGRTHVVHRQPAVRQARVPLYPQQRAHRGQAAVRVHPALRARARCGTPPRALRAWLQGTAARTMPNWREPANGLSYCIKPSSRPSAPASSVLNRIRYLRARRPGARSAAARGAVPARLACPARAPGFEDVERHGRGGEGDRREREDGRGQPPVPAAAPALRVHGRYLRAAQGAPPDTRAPVGRPSAPRPSPAQRTRAPCVWGRRGRTLLRQGAAPDSLCQCAAPCLTWRVHRAVSACTPDAGRRSEACACDTQRA